MILLHMISYQSIRIFSIERKIKNYLKPTYDVVLCMLQEESLWYCIIAVVYYEIKETWSSEFSLLIYLSTFDTVSYISYLTIFFKSNGRAER